MKKLFNNYHTHTKRCHHAIGEDEEYVIAAIKSGIKVLGFSDHEEISLNDFYGINLDGEGIVKGYIQSINNLKEQYKNDIEIHVGLESPYFPYKDEHFKHLGELGIEYMILGQHDLLDKDGNRFYVLSKPFNYDILHQYTDLVIKGIRSGFFSYIAHPDLIICAADKLDKEIFRNIELICIEAKKYDVLLEINVSPFYRRSIHSKYCEAFFEVAGKIGNKVIIGLDVHNPERFYINDYELCLKIVEKYNLNLVDSIEYRLKKLK